MNKQTARTANDPAPPAPAGNERHYTPCEFSAALAARGLTMHPVNVRRRCKLPVRDPFHIRTNVHFSGRRYIPESELDRLMEGNK